MGEKVLPYVCRYIVDKRRGFVAPCIVQHDLYTMSIGQPVEQSSVAYTTTMLLRPVIVVLQPQLDSCQKSWSYRTAVTYKTLFCYSTIHPDITEHQFH